jgi:hypothetical protein
VCVHTICSPQTKYISTMRSTFLPVAVLKISQSLPQTFIGPTESKMENEDEFLKEDDVFQTEFEAHLANDDIVSVVKKVKHKNKNLNDERIQSSRCRFETFWNVTKLKVKLDGAQKMFPPPIMLCKYKFQNDESNQSSRCRFKIIIAKATKVIKDGTHQMCSYHLHKSLNDKKTLFSRCCKQPFKLYLHIWFYSKEEMGKELHRIKVRSRHCRSELNALIFIPSTTLKKKSKLE